MGGKIPEPASLSQFLKKLHSKNINTLSPSQIPKKEWEEIPSFIGTGSWAPDKSIRLWTDSEDNREFIRRLNEIYQKLDQLSWNENINQNLEFYLRIAENSDARGWAPLPERKNEAFNALIEIQRYLFEK